MAHDLKRAQVLEHALRIEREYRGKGLKLTLRQMYYQFVARGLVQSGQNVYKRIGDVLTEARYAGEFPVEGLEDRGRSIAKGDYTRACTDTSDAEADSAGMVAALPAFLLRRARWYGQDTFVSVWVEKEALSGVFADVCTRLGVSLFACKGYPSVSALYEWTKLAYFNVHGEHPYPEHRISNRRRYTFGNGFDWSESHAGTCSRAVILYFGDHDPDGWEIPRSAERNLQTLMATYGLHVPLEFDRIALLKEQIDLYEPPPFDAKVTSARYQGYVDEHQTEDAWELDALDPEVLRDLVSDNVARFFNITTHTTNKREVAALRAQLRERLDMRDAPDDDTDGEE